MMSNPAIDRAYAQGRERWPDIRLEQCDFVRHLEAVAPEERALTEHGAEMFLVAAALAGDGAALRHLDRSFITPASLAARRIDAGDHFLDEVRQQLRLVLLTGENPRLASYAGVGGLVEWLRVAAVRTGLNLRRRDWRLLPTEEVPVERLLPPQSEAELGALRGHYLPQLQQALSASLALLTPRERTLLRLHFLDGLSLDALASMYSVHRATIARHLAAIRRTLLDQARVNLGGDRPLASQSVRSLYRWLGREVHLSVSRLLDVRHRSDDGEPGQGGGAQGTGPGERASG